MSTDQSTSSNGLTTLSRTVASLAVGVVHTLERAVVGEERVRTARGNAWEAVCADRARAHRRAELQRLVEELAANQATARHRERTRADADGSQPARAGGDAVIDEQGGHAEGQPTAAGALPVS